ncbi:MAG: DUF4445 domain-containing protein [Clostridia bacterium]|nr:DUF4445 domain-containing protein [Clostridia bacterium]
MEKCRISFLPEKVQVTVEPGVTLMMAAAEAGVEFEGPCGGRGVCGKCKMNIIEGETTGQVLACQYKVSGDLVVEIPRQEVYLNRKTALTEGDWEIETDPGISKLKLQVEPPSLDNQKSDADRLLQALNRPAKLRLDALRALPQALRAEGHAVTVVLAGDEVLAVEAGDRVKQGLYGLAVDIGTTTVVGSLVELTGGKTVAAASAGNTQNIFGADVISRIQHAAKGPKELEQLRRRVVQVINRLSEKLAVSAGIAPREFYQAAIVCNTTMHHLLLGLDPRYLAPAPFIPVVTEMVEIEAREAGLGIHPHAPVYVLPNVAGYVGADTVGVIVSTGLYNVNKSVLAVDIGTNGEIVLALPGRLLTCSTAAGPAFEGAQIKCGMRAQAGAIEKVKIEDKVSYEVIGDVAPKGICGSGIMDAIAEMFRVGVLESNGRLATGERASHLPESIRERIQGTGPQASFILATAEETGGDPVYLTQKDVREVQLAKGAIRAGIEVLLEHGGVSPADLDEVLLAGAFGSYIDKNSALGMGLLPMVPPEKIRAVGNAAGAGAKLALLSRKARQQAVEAARKAEHVELSTWPQFQEAFIRFLNF